MTWSRNGGSGRREHNALCKGGCGFRLPCYVMATLLPDQRNHYGNGMCEACCKRTYQRERRVPVQAG